MSDWRKIGPVRYEAWQQTILDAGGPGVLGSRFAWKNAGEHSALALAMLGQESSYGTAFNRNRPENRNALNLRPPNGDGYERYPNWDAGVKAWHDRLTSPTYKDGIYAKTRSLEDLIHVYAPASDDNDEAAYVAAIRARLAAWGIQEKNGMADIVFGKVPYPTVDARHLPASNPYVVESGAPPDSAVEAVFWHIMVGTLWGTDSHFRAGNAATAYGVGVASVDGADDAGRIIEWIGRNNGWYGESSGPAIAPYGDGAKLINKVGVNSVNRVTKAIEKAGDPSTPLGTEDRLSIVKITAFFADQRRIPWDQFPIVPGEERSFVIWHNEITGLAYKSCPGTQFMNATPAMIAQTAQYMKEFQQPGAVVVKPPQYAESDLPDWWDDSVKATYPGDNSYKGRKFYVVRRNYVATANTRRLSEPDGHAKASGPLVKAGEKVHGERLVKGTSDWVLTVDGHYLGAGRLSPRVKVTKE